jgi:DNA-binding MarR family transcriptional regulator
VTTSTPSAPQPDAPRDASTLGGDLVVACSRFARTAAQAIDVDVSVTMWRMLSNLAHTGDLSVTELAAIERTSQPTVSKMVKRLEAQGLVSRRPDPTDRRSSAVSVTDAGRASLARYRASLTTALAPHLARLDEDDLRTLDRALDLLAHLTTEVADAGPITSESVT